MEITKIGHCCLVIEMNGKRILTDPGAFTEAQNEERNIDMVLITHEHMDHLHTDSLKTVLAHNPEAIVVCNSAVGKLLVDENIEHTVLEGQGVAEIAGVPLAAYDGEHVEIFQEVGKVQNTGYFIADHLFYPGDAYTEPGREVPVMALPVAGPWCKVSEAIEYALAVKPKTAFPVHDAVLSEGGKQATYPHFKRELENIGSNFIECADGETFSC